MHLRGYEPQRRILGSLTRWVELVANPAELSIRPVFILTDCRSFSGQAIRRLRSADLRRVRLAVRLHATDGLHAGSGCYRSSLANADSTGSLEPARRRRLHVVPPCTVTVTSESTSPTYLMANHAGVAAARPVHVRDTELILVTQPIPDRP